MKYDHEILLLQGGGALGAYQAGVYEGLVEVGVLSEKSYPDVLVMQSSQDRNGDDSARSLDGSMRGRIFL